MTFFSFWWKFLSLLVRGRRLLCIWMKWRCTSCVQKIAFFCFRCLYSLLLRLVSENEIGVRPIVERLVHIYCIFSRTKKKSLVHTVDNHNFALFCKRRCSENEIIKLHATSLCSMLCFISCHRELHSAAGRVRLQCYDVIWAYNQPVIGLFLIFFMMFCFYERRLASGLLETCLYIRV